MVVFCVVFTVLVVVENPLITAVHPTLAVIKLLALSQSRHCERVCCLADPWDLPVTGTVSQGNMHVRARVVCECYV